MSETDWTRIAGLVADGVDLSKGDKVSVFMTDPLAMPAVESFVEECYRRGAVPQVLATDERFDRAVGIAPPRLGCDLRDQAAGLRCCQHKA